MPKKLHLSWTNMKSVEPSDWLSWLESRGCLRNIHLMPNKKISHFNRAWKGLKENQIVFKTRSSCCSCQENLGRKIFERKKTLEEKLAARLYSGSGWAEATGALANKFIFHGNRDGSCWQQLRWNKFSYFDKDRTSLKISPAQKYFFNL